MQAASLRLEMGRVVDNRITLKTVQRGTPTVSSGRKAAVLGAGGRVRRTPPGSNVAADTASISRVQVPPSQWLDSDR